jgi:putative membrane protein
LAPVQRWLTAAEDLKHQVWARAEVEFNREIAGRTRSNTGILLFLSRMERQAVVLADKGIASKLPPETWSKVVGLIVDGARTSQWAAKFEEALRVCGGLLASHFPQELDDSNELPNQVIVKD